MSSKTSSNAGPTTAGSEKIMFWSGWGLTGLTGLALIFSAVLKLSKAVAVIEEFGRLGYREVNILPIGVTELAIAVIYLVPRTSVLGAILVTGYLGGATATHVRVGDPFISPIIMGMLVWLGLFLRDARLRALIPWRR